MTYKHHITVTHTYFGRRIVIVAVVVVVVVVVAGIVDLVRGTLSLTEVPRFDNGLDCSGQ